MTEPIIALSEDQNISFVYSLILLAFLSGSLFLHFRNKPSTALKQAAIWVVIICVLIIGYSYRYNFYDIKDRLVGELSPSKPIENEDGSLSFRISNNGHYYIKTKINGRTVQFMLDTGASDVVITQRIAMDIGINLNNLQYTKIYNTANGRVRGAPIRLNRMTIGNYTVHDIRASVNSSDMNTPLLGMSFLEKLDGYEVRDGILTLWP